MDFGSIGTEDAFRLITVNTVDHRNIANDANKNSFLSVRHLSSLLFSGAVADSSAVASD